MGSKASEQTRKIYIFQLLLTFMAYETTIERLNERKKSEAQFRALELYYHLLIAGHEPTQAYVAGVVGLRTPDIVEFVADTEGIGIPDSAEEAEQYLEALLRLKKAQGFY